MKTTKRIPKSPLDRATVQRKLSKAMISIGQGLQDFMSVAESELSHTRYFNSTGMVQILEQFSLIMNTVEHYREYLEEETKPLAEQERIDILPLLKTSDWTTLTEYMEGDYNSFAELAVHYATRSVFYPSETNSPYDGERELIESPRKSMKLESEDLSELFEQS